MNILRTELYPSSLLNSLNGLGGFNSGSAARFQVDIEESDSDYRITADLPGIAKEQVSVNVEGDVLTISAEFAGAGSADNRKPLRRERSSGKASRQFILSPQVQGENINAALENGVLTVVLPKGENSRQRKIAIS